MRWSRIATIAGFVLAIVASGPRAPASTSGPRAALAIAWSPHPGNAATALAKIDASGEVSIALRFDTLAFALDEFPAKLGDGPRAALLDGPDPALATLLGDARGRLTALLELTADGARIPVDVVEFPTVAEVRAWQHEHPERRLQMKLDARARAAAPRTTTTIALRFPEVLGDVILTLEQPGGEPVALPLRAGEHSPEIGVQLGAAGDAESGLDAPTGGSAIAPPDPGSPGTASPPIRGETPITALDAAARFIRLGFTHILPAGLDHVLFVLGLFLMSTRTRALLLQITAFTVAHSMSLALSMFGVVELPAGIVEPVIAASIAFVAIENVVTDRLHAWRPFVVFAFGLIHGMGFAGVLREHGLPRGRMATALVSFNVGVELGQLAVIALAFAAIGWWRRREWYRERIVVPASLAIAAIGLYWTVQRLV